MNTRILVRDAWLCHENLMSHRAAYFDAKVHGVIDRSVAKYGVEDVCAAINAYSAVLASRDHYFKHGWTLGDFLNRGLDRFVPEAKPLEVFRQTDDRLSRSERKSKRIQSLLSGAWRDELERPGGTGD